MSVLLLYQLMSLVPSERPNIAVSIVDVEQPTGTQPSATTSPKSNGKLQNSDSNTSS